ncbi:MAG: hypothetical protein ACRC8S_02580 [Fimbriiglobus sp.]
MSDVLAVELIGSSLEVMPRTGEPVRFGLPWPRGAAKDGQFRLIAPDGSIQPLASKTLDRWGDGSVRWALFTANLTARGDGQTGYRIEAQAGSPTIAEPKPTTGSFQLELLCGAYDDDAKPVPGKTYTLFKETFGPELRHYHHTVGVGFSIDVRIEPLANSNVRKVTVCLANTLAAEHPGGNWDLGMGGGEEIVALNIHVPVKGSVTWSAERGAKSQSGSSMSLWQASSGGVNWDSTNHMNAARKVPLPFRGYRTTTNTGTQEGLRATPIVVAGSGAETVGVTMTEFWENFPKAVSVQDDKLTFALFPEASGPHELQGGEQKTHTVYLSFGPDAITTEPLAWCRSPLVVHASPEWYAASGALPYLTPEATDPNTLARKLANLAFEGQDTFETKRETIDEYGWRNYGDIYGDHEAVYHKGPKPLISHDNNQYDCVAALFQQFFRNGRINRYLHGLACADHTLDIDIYHTDGDKAAYNGGLFWHTYHYADADTGTHRSYPKILRTGGHFESGQDLDKMGETGKNLKKNYAVGGGPAASHNYNLGLILAYFLTGEERYKQAAIGLAEFVLNMEDPRRTVFRWLSSESTGLASEASPGYHGPGRAAGNSILATLVGHQLTGEAKYLAKCEEVIRRVVSPKQNLAKLDLLNAELRWFYTMTLQALGVYLDYKIELNQLDRMYASTRLSLLHYARWMAEHERPILDTPEKLQYPTETWAAQDLRKIEVFQFAAKHADSEAEREKFLERAEWFYQQSLQKLDTFETKSLCRPMILTMRYAYSRTWWQQNPKTQAPKPTVMVAVDEFPEWQMFVPQKAKAIARAKKLILLGGALGGVTLLAGLAWLVGAFR